MLLYSRKKVRYRRDGYCWKKRKDGKTTREDHMKLKVQGMEVIGFCFYIINEVSVQQTKKFVAFFILKSLLTLEIGSNQLHMIMFEKHKYKPNS